MTRIAFGPLLASAASLFLAPVAHAQAGAEPEDERGLRLVTEKAFPGYTLFTPESSKTVYLIDLHGEVVHTWETNARSGALYLLENGNLMRCATPGESPRFNGGGIGGAVQELDWEGNVLWHYDYSDDYQCQHHDIEPLPNGNVLLISWEHRYQEDAIAFGRDPAQIGEDGMWPDAVYEIEPIRPEGGNIVWEWHTWDHLIQDFDESTEGYGSIPDDPGKIDINGDHRDQPPITEEQRQAQEELLEEMQALGYMGDDADDVGGTAIGSSVPDWLHTNAIDYNEEYDLIVLSTPTLGEIWVIDHSTTIEEAAFGSGGRWGNGGDLLWRWGNPRLYGAGGPADQHLFYQHDPVFIPGEKPGELRLLVFNNNASGRDAESGYSTVEELILPFDPSTGFRNEPDAAFGPSEPVWSYSDPGKFHSSFISGAQRLPNGNTLICSGAPGRVFEVTHEGEIIWEYLNPYADNANVEGGDNAPTRALFRATRIAADHPALAGKGL